MGEKKGIILDEAYPGPWKWNRNLDAKDGTRMKHKQYSHDPISLVITKISPKAVTHKVVPYSSE